MDKNTSKRVVSRRPTQKSESMLRLETGLASRHASPSYGGPITQIGFVRGFCPTYRGKPTGAAMHLAPPRIWNQDLADARAMESRLA